MKIEDYRISKLSEKRLIDNTIARGGQLPTENGIYPILICKSQGNAFLSVKEIYIKSIDLDIAHAILIDHKVARDNAMLVLIVKDKKYIYRESDKYKST